MSRWADKLAPTVRDLPPSGIRKFFDLVMETKGVVSLGVGEPDFVTPWHIREACVYSLEKGYTMYTSNHGTPELREAISKDIEKNYGVQYNPKTEMIITVGASEALDIALRSIIVPGDEVIIPEPCFVSYKPCTVLAGGVPVTIATTVETEFRVTAEQIEAAITPKTKAILICYPNNPTGAIISREELLAIAAVAEKHDLIVISDEIYDKLTYEGQHTCFSSLPGMKDRTILINGFSKSHAMTGWRVGYVAANPDFIAAMVKVHQYIIMCAPVMAQKAAYEAIVNGEQAMVKMVQSYNQRRKLMVQGFQEIGLECFEPKGAFYIFPSIKSTGLGSEEFSTRLLKEEKVAVVPGNAFGEGGEGFIRCSYASSVQQLTEALERLDRFVRKIR